MRIALFCLVLLPLIRSSLAHLRSHRKLIRAQDLSARIDQQYILVFSDSVKDVDAKVASLTSQTSSKSSVLFTYKDNFKGASINQLSDADLWRILEDPDITFAEEDQRVRAYVDQTDPSWGLDRIDNPSLPLDDKYHYDYTGAGVTVFVVDSGIRSTHHDFGGRVTCGYSVFPNNDCSDEVGHGTHVAGTIGGTTYGVAKDVQLVVVRVLNSDAEGSMSSLLGGIDYIRGQKQNNPDTPMVANLSLGGSASTALDAAVENVVAAGVVFVVAAGNDDTDACYMSPGSAAKAITVSATDSHDDRAYFSNYGSCVDIFAPGEQITSTWPTSDTATHTLSGTSMAAPFVAGVAALYLEANPTWTPDLVWKAMQAHAASGVVGNPGSLSADLMVTTSRISAMPNMFAFVGLTEGGDSSNSQAGQGVSSNAVASTTPETNPINNLGGAGEACHALFASCTAAADCCSKTCNFNICWL